MSTDNVTDQQNLTPANSQPVDEASPLGPLETREIENATESDDSDTTTHEYSPYVSEVEEEKEIAHENEGESEELVLEPQPGPSHELPRNFNEMSLSEDVSPIVLENEDETMEYDNEQIEPSVIEEMTEEADYDDSLDDVYDAGDEEEIEEEEEVEYEDEDDDADDEDEGSDTEELVDLNDDEEVTFDPNYFPTSIPPLIETDSLKTCLPTLPELQAAIQEGDDFPFALLDDFQLDLENYMRSNLYKQLSIIDEISKLLTNAPAYFEFDQLPSFNGHELPVENIPIEYKPTTESRLRCSEKDQAKLYLVELWWVWVETVMPKITDSFLKSFKANMIDKYKPKHMPEYFVNHPETGLKLTKNDVPLEVNDYDVKLYELQIIEDDELESDYEPDFNLPIFYKMVVNENDETGPEYPEKIVLDDSEEAEYFDDDDQSEGGGKKRKRSLIDTNTTGSAKRFRPESLPISSKDMDSPRTEPPVLTLSRRRSSQSCRSSLSPPVLSPQLPIKTPTKSVDSPRAVESSPSTSRKDKKKETDSEKLEKRKQRKKSRSKNLKSIKEGESTDFAENREQLSDSESVLSISDVDFDLTDEDDKSCISCNSFTRLRRRLADLSEEAHLAEELSAFGGGGVLEQFAEEHMKDKSRPVEDTNVLQEVVQDDEFNDETPDFEMECYSPETPIPNLPLKTAEEESEPELYDSEQEVVSDGKSTSDSDDEDDLDFSQAKWEFNGIPFTGDDLATLLEGNVVSLQPDLTVVDKTEGKRMFPSTIVPELEAKLDKDELDPISRELLNTQRELAVALFQLRQKSKVMLDFLAQEADRQELVAELDKAEENLFDNLECPAEQADPEKMQEGYQVLTTYYSENGISMENSDDDMVDLLALRHLDINERNF
uniref:Uncharacterized protein n=1 Tax=Panagrolaimus sp. JU765 TaxID=591449 RepID=A0AC34R307_9BILA